MIFQIRWCSCYRCGLRNRIACELDVQFFTQAILFQTFVKHKYFTFFSFSSSRYRSLVNSWVWLIFRYAVKLISHQNCQVHFPYIFVKMSRLFFYNLDELLATWKRSVFYSLSSIAVGETKRNEHQPFFANLR